jgi:tRNA modification GTPase
VIDEQWRPARTINRDRLRCAVLTPAGRGAIATIGLRGSEALPALNTCFASADGRPVTAASVGRVRFGKFSLAPGFVEELIVGVLAADEIEIHCHGGSAASDAICRALAAVGCEVVSTSEWAEQSHADALAADAAVALGRCRTERTAAVLLDQQRGALRQSVEQIQSLLATGDIEAAQTLLQEIADRADLGLHLTQPWKVVIAGRPNAGKSTLLNAILGYQRAIVFSEPGTTRDVLTATTALDGWLVELADTAGLHLTNDPIEAAGIEATRKALRNADLVVYASDLTGAWDQSLFEEVAAQAAEVVIPNSRRVLVVHTKSDLASAASDRPAGLAVSAREGTDIDKLCGIIVQALVPMPPPPGAAVPFAPLYVEAIRSALGAVKVASVSRAQAALAALLARAQKPG